MFTFGKIPAEISIQECNKNKYRDIYFGKRNDFG